MLTSFQKVLEIEEKVPKNFQHRSRWLRNSKFFAVQSNTELQWFNNSGATRNEKNNFKNLIFSFSKKSELIILVTHLKTFFRRRRRRKNTKRSSFVSTCVTPFCFTFSKTEVDVSKISFFAETEAKTSTLITGVSNQGSQKVLPQMWL